MTADNQKISNLAKLKDLEKQLELARARTETIEARVETIKALMKIDEIREKEALEKEALEKSLARAREIAEKEIREKEPEIFATVIDDAYAPWQGSYVTGLNAYIAKESARKIDEIREKEARIKEIHEKEALEQLEKLSVNHLWGNEKEFLKTMKMMNIESLESNEAAKTKLKKADLHSCDDDTTCPWDSSYVSGMDTDTTIAFSRKFNEILEKEAGLEKEASENWLARAALEIVENHR